ncbi:hypothetical protein MHYP_G00103370 [Metynnis hypsauchen]
MVDGTTASPMCLHVEAPEEVTEGETADLTCKTTCSLTDPTFIWYKDGRPLTTKTIKNNQLHLQTVSSEDAGSYSCAVRGDQHLHSTAHSLRVRYRPKNVSVSISPSGEIVEGSSVTLTCSSDGNPPVKIYTWFKGSASVGEGKTYSIPDIRSEDNGEYTCQSWNYHRKRRSTAVQINVKYPPKSVSVSISPSGEIVEGSSATLTCSSDGNPPVECHWFIGTLLVVKEKNYTITKASSVDSGEYKCKCMNELGEKYSEALTLDVWYPTKSISVSITPSGEIMEGSSVTLTCSSNANPPVKIYTWFKGSTSVAEGKTYSIPNIRSEDSGEYTCQSRNDHRERRSTTVHLDVWYPPKRVSVSISPSGEIVEGSSVTLTCSSDGNPPVKNYTWFKEGGTSPVGSGQNYSIINITADHKGWYHCEAWNKLGKHSASVALLLHPVRSYMTVFVIVGLACFGAVIIVCFVCLMIRRAKRTVQVPLPRPCDGKNIYFADQDAHVALKYTGSPFCDTCSTLDDTYVVPGDQPHGLDEPYANVHTNSADDVYMTHDEDGSPIYENAGWK